MGTTSAVVPVKVEGEIPWGRGRKDGNLESRLIQKFYILLYQVQDQTRP